MPISPGDPLPAFTVLRAHADPITSADLLADGAVVLHVFPLAFSGNLDGG